MRALPAVEFAAAYRLVAQAADDLPLIFWVNVLDREFKQKFDAPRFVPDLGAFLSLGAASRTLEECRTRGSPQSLAEIPEVCLKQPQRLEVCYRVLLQTVIPALTEMKGDGARSLLGLRDSLLSELPSAQARDGGKDASRLFALQIRQCALALAVPFQNELITGEQLEILTAVRSPKEEHEKVLQ